jgi:hypothetical protein
MADIVLAEYQGRAWIISGDQFIDDLLANTLAPEVCIELIVCKAESEINHLWERRGAESQAPGARWAVHPGIVNRIRRQQSDHSILFGQWSAMIEGDGLLTLQAAASLALRHGSMPVEIVSFVGPDGPKALLDLANLRCGLIEAQLDSLGVAASRFVRVTRDAASEPGMTSDSQRIDIIVRVTGRS